MAQAAIRVSDLDAERLPEVCAKTGRPATGTLRTSALREPTRFSEIVPFGRSTTVHLPASTATMQDINDARRLFVGWVVVAVVLTLVALLTGAKILYPVVIGLLIGGYLQNGWARYRKWVGAQIADDEIWVKRAHPEFCRAAGRLYGQPATPDEPI